MNRKQTPSPQKKAQTKSSGRSEELDEIIDRMPMASENGWHWRSLYLQHYFYCSDGLSNTRIW